MKHRRPRFSSIQIFLWTASLIALLASAQQHLDAFIRIIDNMDRAGDVGIYRFTLELNEGDIIRTYFPDSVEYTGDATDNVAVCRQYLISSTEPISACTFDASSNMIEFPIPTTASAGFFMYELGELKNPAYSQTLRGFIIQILDSSDNILYQSNEMMVFVRINPNEITEQSLQVSS